MKEEIEKIIKKYATLVEGVSLAEDGIPPHAMIDNRQLKQIIAELTTLIEKERASAVRSFGKWFDGGKGQFGDFVEEYLKTLEPTEYKKLPNYDGELFELPKEVYMNELKKRFEEIVMEVLKEYQIMGSIPSEKKNVVNMFNAQVELSEKLTELFATEINDMLGKTWYFEGDELVIKKGKWIIDRYKRHETPEDDLDEKIKKEGESAVEDFVGWLKKKDTGVGGVSFRTSWTLFGIKSEAEEYLKALESEDK